MTTQNEDCSEDFPSAGMSADEVRRILRQRELDAIEAPPGAAPRNTYKASHALKIKRYFEEACNQHKNVCIPYSEFMCKAKRMHAIICDSLLWLCYNDTDKVKWATFKTQINLRVSGNADEGIWIEWRKNTGRGSKHLQEPLPGMSLPSEQTVDYLEKLIAWVEGDRENMLRIEGLNLSLEKQQAAIRLFEAAGVTQYKVEPSRIMAI